MFTLMSAEKKKSVQLKALYLCRLGFKTTLLYWPRIAVPNVISLVITGIRIKCGSITLFSCLHRHMLTASQM